MSNEGNVPQIPTTQSETEHSWRSAPPQGPLPVPPDVHTPRSRSLWLLVGIPLLALLVVTAASYTAIQFLTQRSAKQATPTTQVPSAPTATPAPTSKGSSFNSARCPFRPGPGLVEGRDVRCGYLVVQEDRSQTNSKTIKLAVAIFKDPTTSRPTTPVVYLTGGPGGALLENWSSYIDKSNITTFTQGHDLIMFDQRGNGYSQPSLRCPEVDAFQYATLNQNLSGEESNSRYLDVVKTCQQRLLKNKINLKAYTTIANADDVHDLIHTLNYKKAALYGVSYGTRLALTVMRLYPTDIESVILDSVFPPQKNLIGDLPSLIPGAYSNFFKGCAASTRCSSSYPQLEPIFYQLIDKLNQDPITIIDKQHGEILINGDALADWFFAALYWTSLLSRLPEIIYHINDGNYTELEQLFGIVMFDDTFSLGTYYAVQCSEDAPYLNEKGVEAAANRIRSELRDNILSDIQTQLKICQLFKQKPVPTTQKQAVTSTIPTLILSGQYDPITPLANATLTASTLSKSYLFQFPSTGHGVRYTSTCADSIVRTFLNNPNVKPDGGCINTIGEPAFT